MTTLTLKAFTVVLLPMVLFMLLHSLPHLPGLPDPSSGARTTWYFILQDLNQGIISLICLVFGAVTAWILGRSQPENGLFALFLVTLFMSSAISKLPWIVSNTSELFSSTRSLVSKWSEPAGYIEDTGMRVTSVVVLLVISAAYVVLRKRLFPSVPQ